MIAVILCSSQLRREFSDFTVNQTEIMNEVALLHASGTKSKCKQVNEDPPYQPFGLVGPRWEYSLRGLDAPARFATVIV